MNTICSLKDHKITKTVWTKFVKPHSLFFRKLYIKYKVFGNLSRTKFLSAVINSVEQDAHVGGNIKITIKSMRGSNLQSNYYANSLL